MAHGPALEVIDAAPGPVDDAADVIATALLSEVVHVAGLRLYPASDEQVATNIVAAPKDARFELVRRIPQPDRKGRAAPPSDRRSLPLSNRSAVTSSLLGGRSTIAR